jgi:YidC/Oxa1 family membrane protein insertase
MNFDRNTVIGFIVLAVLFGGYFWWTSKEQSAFRKQKAIEQAKTDSINALKAKQNPVASQQDSLHTDTLNKLKVSGQFQKAVFGEEKTFTIDNGVLSITFSSKGGQPKKVELKKFNGPDSTPVKLASSDFDKIDYSVNTGTNSSGYISEFNFHLDTVIENADKSQLVVFALRPDSTGPAIRHQFIIRRGDYMIDFTIQMEGADKLLTQGNLNLTWQYKALQQESDISFEKQNTQVGYMMDGDFDYHTIGRRSSKDFDKPVKWIGVRQRFFNTFLVAKNNFSSGRMEWIIPPDTAKTVLQSIANMRMQLAVDRSASVPFSILYGPADFKMLKQHDMNFEKLINLGQGAYAFVRPLNRFIVIPVFDFIKSFTVSMGLAIALLTIFIRTITSPLMYPGYKTSAQMKVLRPDLAKLKEKFPEQQQYAMEQMKFTREAGVNQFAGCLPALVQIPIFFSLYSFFNSNVSFRGQSFLWAKDLSAFDDVIKFGVNIPLLGSHLSLFTITAVITSFLISLYSMSTAMSPDQSNPVMKYMPYIFPFFLLFIFNRLPSALTWYYTVSNVITLILQFIIQNYIIDHDKILSKIEENRKKPKTKSKWQERMEQMQEQQKKMKELQQKNRR